MPRVTGVLLALALALALAAAACGGGGGEAATPRTTTTAPTTTTTRPADLNAARVGLTKVADVTGGTAFAVRAGDPTLYIARQTGQVVAVRDGQVDPTPVLDLAGRLLAGGEQGLLGIAFSPDATKLYVHFTGTEGETRLEELPFTAAPGGGGHADAAAARLLLTAPGLQENHNGGQLTFGPDGMLYLGLGDGGAGGDEGDGHAPEGNGQSRATLLGKILRIDPTPSAGRPYTIPPDNPYVSGGGLPEIWVYGLRNPWRFSFDSSTRDLWIADVGQNLWEELDMVPFDRAAGSNFGWPLLEATHDYRGGAVPGSTVLPVFETSHADGNCAITGGYVYRGTRIPDLDGAYVFSDNCNGAIRAITVAGGQVTAQRDLGIASGEISSFGIDAKGELYVVSLSDGIFRIDAA